MATAARDEFAAMNDEGKERQMTEDTATATVDEPTEVEDGDDHGPHVLVVSMPMSGLGALGSLGALGALLEDAPDSVKEILAAALEDAKLRRLAEEIKEWVTTEIADAILWCYGDLDGTTEPSMADAALINLLRVAHISDEHMLMHLNEVEHFHGYVIAMMFLAERGPQGMHILRKIAGLIPGETYSGTEKLPDDVAKATSEDAETHE